jgi:hypothetical protein
MHTCRSGLMAKRQVQPKKWRAFLRPGVAVLAMSPIHVEDSAKGESTRLWTCAFGGWGLMLLRETSTHSNRRQSTYQ